MGRCYEFGVLVGKDCEHAMVVPAGGGRCECATCGVACTGKFAACTAIIDTPGYVPSAAPAWALVRGDRQRPPSGAPRPAEQRVVPPVVPSGLAEALAERDAALAARLDALAVQIAKVQRQGEELQSAVADLTDLVRRLDPRTRPAPLFGFPRRQA